VTAPFSLHRQKAAIELYSWAMSDALISGESGHLVSRTPTAVTILPLYSKVY
jgi:hypothetical protein